MATRTEIVTEAARRLGDQSSDFVAEVNSAFDYVLADLALEGCIQDLRKVASSAVTVTSQINYDTRTLCGLSSPHYPSQVYSLRVRAWGAAGILRRASDQEYEWLRHCDGENATGRPYVWRVYPNIRQVQLWPPASSENADATLEVEYLAPPSILAGGDDISELRFEDLETIIYGLMARGVGFKDQTAIDLEAAFASYIAGRNRMYARVHNAPSVQDIAPQGI